MRTTVDIEEDVLERARALALKEKQPLGAVVNQALAAYLGSRRQAGKDPPFELLVAGSAHGRFPTLTEIAAVEEEEDARSIAIPEPKRDAAP